MVTTAAPWMHLSRNLQSSTANDCICLAGEQPVAGEGPTAKSFEVAFTNAIAELEFEGALSVEATANNIVEGQQVSCFGEVRDFTTLVLTDFGEGIDFESLSNEAKESIEQIFLDSYNDLAFDAW